LFGQFSGNPLACAIARTALKVLTEDGLIENAKKMGEYFMEGLRKIDNPKIKEVRGRGLLIGVEFHDDAGGARQYCEKLKEAGLLCKETHETIIRFAPPLVITKKDIDWALERITPILSK
jgi:ornithine--oxo-acid transaminase